MIHPLTQKLDALISDWRWKTIRSSIVAASFAGMSLAFESQGLAAFSIIWLGLALVAAWFERDARRIRANWLRDLGALDDEKRG